MPLLTEKDFPFPFPEAQKEEGRRLVQEQKVLLLERAGGSLFEARIPFFRRHHQVWLERSPGGRVDHDCTCPHLENTGQGCAHLYALMLVANAVAARSAAPEITAGAPPLLPLYLLSPGEGLPACRLGLGRHTASGHWEVLRADAETLAAVEEEVDRKILGQLAPAAGGRRSLLEGGGFTNPEGPWPLEERDRQILLPLLDQTGRLYLRCAPGDPPARLQLDLGPAWELVLGFRPRSAGTAESLLTGWVRREQEILELRECTVLATDRAPLLAARGRLLPIEAFGASEWLSYLRRHPEARVPRDEVEPFLTRLASSGPLPRIQLPGQTVPLPLDRRPPTPCLAIERRGPRGRLGFDYGGREVDPESGLRLVLDSRLDRQWLRDRAEEEALARDLESRAGVECEEGVIGLYHLEADRLEDLAATLLESGWKIRIDQRPLRSGGVPVLRLRSGLDWFELEGGLDFGQGIEVPLLEILEARRAGRPMVELRNGDRGLIPASWAARLEEVLHLAEERTGSYRFRGVQALLLEPILGAELAAAPDLHSWHQNLLALASPGTCSTPSGIEGRLRPYQEVGLAWLRRLAHLRLGGCLADDMGLGKTLQALALLLCLKEDPPDGWAGAAPALVVCPRSLLWNWKEEVRRFTPSLRSLEHHGPGRATGPEDFAAFDLVLTTYGTLQRDQELLSSVTFSVVILDEAQAIKNPRSKSAAAARSLTGLVRLSLTGTPVENSLRDLWSQMEFLNPGLLGSESRFIETLGESESGASRALLARALRPLILRRTKEEVLPDLPPKVEQILFADLTEEQEQLYTALREEARQALEQRLAASGVEASRWHVLESLLRLRQVACHPGLLDPRRRASDSGKLDLLLEELDQVVAGGHKALVFSQFTSFLKLVGDRLEERALGYATLDGTTRDRARVVQRFQEDAGCPVLLVSLKVGGVGLNLTSADYVFILDPWWNPAVETQAVDRAHRLGQTRPVFAYRLVAARTVEERILELQSRKRELAEAVLSPGPSALALLSADDLRLLLS